MSRFVPESHTPHRAAATTMKPLTLNEANNERLAELGRASVQIVHDLKNQLNGLKLYATFLRKRFQGRETATDELETIDKLMAGLERATADATVLVHYGRPLELRRQPFIKIRKLLQTLVTDDQLAMTPQAGDAAGNFDVPLLTEAFRHITEYARANNGNDVDVSMTGDDAAARIEWRGVRVGEENPFTSFIGGSGLRLALARRIIEEHGGSVAHTPASLIATLPTG